MGLWDPGLRLQPVSTTFPCILEMKVLIEPSITLNLTQKLSCSCHDIHLTPRPFRRINFPDLQLTLTRTMPVRQSIESPPRKTSNHLAGVSMSVTPLSMLDQLLQVRIRHPKFACITSTKQCNAQSDLKLTVDTRFSLQALPQLQLALTR